VLPVSIGPGNLGDQLGFGERQGVDSARPEIQGRLVFQWQLDKAKGVAPAQIILSGMEGRRKAIVIASAIPSCNDTLNLLHCPGGANTFKTAFPHGAEVESDRHGFSGGIQLPTRFVTLVANYYNGTDLRFYFAGQILQEFNDTLGLTRTATTTPQVGCAPVGWNCAPAIDGSTVILFGINSAGVPTFVPQQPVRTQGGFAELNFPLSRIFNAEPTGRNAGWTLTLHYGLDNPNHKDAARFGATTRARSDWAFGNIQYKMNQFVTFAVEESYYRTHDLTSGLAYGKNVRSWHDFRSEFATIFTF
jgi:hypothetical protein